jgi:hypothetical protein
MAVPRISLLPDLALDAPELFFSRLGDLQCEILAGGMAADEKDVGEATGTPGPNLLEDLHPIGRALGLLVLGEEAQSVL